MKLSKLFNCIGLVLALLVSVAIVVIVYFQMRSQALNHYESIANAILDRQTATQVFFKNSLRPKVFELLDKVGDEEYFEPVWMSTAYFIRNAETIYESISDERFIFRESAINARSASSEAEDFERDFIEEMNRDPDLAERSEIRMLDGLPYLIVLRKGKAIEGSCLRCHGDPQDAPRGMLQRYPEGRSFNRQVGEIASAYSVRVPLSAAVQEARHFTFQLSGLLLTALGGIFFVQYLINKRLFFAPLEMVRRKAIQIAGEPDRLGERIPAPFGRELLEMTDAFNSMSLSLGAQRENLEQLVEVRTKQLTKVVDRLSRDIEDRKRAERALAALQHEKELILDSVWEGIFGLDKNGQAKFLNTAAERMLGWTAEELVGKDIHEIIHPSSAGGPSHPRERCSALTSLARGTVHRVIGEVFWRKDGTCFPVELSSAPIRENNETVGAVITFRDITERQKAERRIRQLAYFDPLTGLPNRRLLLDRLNRLLADEKRNGGEFAVLFIDLDGFKDINDTLGHSNGDRFLQVIAERLKNDLRESDTLARLGGDEFIFVGKISNPVDASVIARKFLYDLSRPVELEGQVLFSSGSIGVSLFPSDGEDMDTLLMNADVAMYQAKAKGKNTFQYFSEKLTSKSLERMNLARDLRLAVEREEFFLQYQVQFDFQAKRVTGVEALLRWLHPEKGMIGPSEFIPLAEETGLILPIGEWVLRTACVQNRTWQMEGLPAMRMALNLAGSQFTQPEFIDTVDRILEETGLDPDYLEMELTESMVMENAEETILTLTDLRARGIHLAIDDFGTGYSSLSYLKHFPIDRLKIAQSFVRDIPGNSEDSAIVEAIIAMGHSLGIGVIAEGVETREQMEFLLSRDCSDMQGYLFAKPMSAEELTEKMKSAAGGGNLLSPGDSASA